MVDWCNEIRYLGIFITNGTSFQCNLHYSKVKFFSSLNGILCKIGTTTSLSVSISLIKSFAIPVLLYGLEKGFANSKALNKLNYAFNSVFYKLFSIFDPLLILHCQYYMYYLPLNFAVHLRYLNLCNSLFKIDDTPVKKLFMLNCFDEYKTVAQNYNVNVTESNKLCYYKVWSVFTNSVSFI